jgi:hypothetical protein
MVANVWGEVGETWDFSVSLSLFCPSAFIWLSSKQRYLLTNSINVRVRSNGKYSVQKEKNEFIEYWRIKVKDEDYFPLKNVLFSTCVNFH